MSKKLADKLSLDIDAPSTTVFTMGNGVKQPALGLIYDVPISAVSQVTIPAPVEVLPTLPSHLLIGTDFMAKRHARITLETNTLKLRYKNSKAEVPVAYIRKTEEGKTIKPSPLVISADEISYSLEGSKKKTPTSRLDSDDSDSDSDEEDLATDDDVHYENGDGIPNSDGFDSNYDQFFNTMCCIHMSIKAYN